MALCSILQSVEGHPEFLVGCAEAKWAHVSRMWPIDFGLLSVAVHDAIVEPLRHPLTLGIAKSH